MTERNLGLEILENRTLHTPFGFNQGDPLIVCKDSTTDSLRASAEKLHIRGYYCGCLAMLGGRRFDQIYFDIHGTHMSPHEFTQFWRWVAESVMTCTPPFTQFKGVTFV